MVILKFDGCVKVRWFALKFDGMLLMRTLMFDGYVKFNG